MTNKITKERFRDNRSQSSLLRVPKLTTISYAESRTRRIFSYYENGPDLGGALACKYVRYDS